MHFQHHHTEKSILERSLLFAEQFRHCWQDWIFSVENCFDAEENSHFVSNDF